MAVQAGRTGRPAVFLPVLIILIIVLCFCYTEDGKREEPPPQNRRKAGYGMDCVIRQVAGHVEVYSHSGVFLFSADSTREAMQELREEWA